MKDNTNYGSSVIEADVQMLGDISFMGDFHVSGKVTGNIVAPMDSSAILYVQSGSVVDGEIRVPTLVVSGSINGDIYVENQLDVAASARIKGNVSYAKLRIASGAEVDGRVNCLDSKR